MMLGNAISVSEKVKAGRRDTLQLHKGSSQTPLGNPALNATVNHPRKETEWVSPEYRESWNRLLKVPVACLNDHNRLLF